MRLNETELHLIKTALEAQQKQITEVIATAFIVDPEDQPILDAIQTTAENNGKLLVKIIDAIEVETARSGGRNILEKEV